MLPKLAPEMKESHRARCWGIWLLAFLILFLAAIPRLANLDVFIGPDETSWVSRASNFFWAVFNGDFPNTYQTGHPGIFQMWVNTVFAVLRYAFMTVTGGNPDLAALVGPDDSIKLLAAKRWDLAFVNALMVVGMFLLGRQAFGTPTGLLGALMVALDPFYLSEARQLRTEAPAAALMLLSLLAFMAYLRRDKWFYLVLCAGLGSLAVLARVTSAFLAPFLALLLGLRLVLRWRSSGVVDWRSTLYTSLILIAASAVVTFALWPALWVDPVGTLSAMTSYIEVRADEGKQDAGVFFMGQTYPDDPGSLFYPVVLLFRSTPLLWIGVLWSVVKLLLDLARRRWSLLDLDAPGSFLNWSVVILLLYSFLYMAMINFSKLKFDRYLMPALLSLDFTAAIGLFWLIKRFEGLTSSAMSRFLPPRAALLSVGAAIVIAVQGFLVWMNHPYYYTYYNPLLGGIQRAQGILRVGYGEGVDKVAAYLNAKPDSEDKKFASAMSSRFRPIFSGEPIPMGNLDGRWVQADYVFVYISQLQRDKHDPEILSYLAGREAEYVLWLQGLEYGRLYPGPAAQNYSGTKLEGRGTLYGYDLGARELKAGEVLKVKLYWRNEGQQATDAFFVEIQDAAGYRWAMAYAAPRRGFEGAAGRRKEIVESEARLWLPTGMPPGHYFLKMGFVADGGKTLVGRFELPDDGDDVLVGLPDTWAGAEGAPVSHAVNFGLSDVSLLGYDLWPQVIEAGERGWLTLHWRAEQDEPQDYVVGIRMMDASGEEITYWLGRPVYSGYATSEWKRGQLVQDPWELMLPEGVAPGDYELEIVLFDAVTGEPLTRAALATWSVVAP